MTPVCLNCGTMMNCTKTGARLFECKAPMMPEMPPPDQIGNIRAVWAADVFTCPDCRAEVATHFGAGPLAEECRPDSIKQAYDAYPEKVFFVGQP